MQINWKSGIRKNRNENHAWVPGWWLKVDGSQLRLETPFGAIERIYGGLLIEFSKRKDRTQLQPFFTKRMILDGEHSLKISEVVPGQDPEGKYIPWQEKDVLSDYQRQLAWEDEIRKMSMITYRRLGGMARYPLATKEGEPAPFL